MAATSTSHYLYDAVPLWSGTIGSGGVPDGTVTTIPLSSASGLIDGNAYIFTIDRVDANGNKTPSKREVCRGVLSGNNFINCVRGVEGTAQAHSAGAVVEILFTAHHWDKLIEGWEVEHNQDGTHNTDYVVTPTAIQTLTNKTLIMNNNDAILQKDSSGIARNVVKINSSNILQFADANLSGISIPFNLTTGSFKVGLFSKDTATTTPYSVTGLGFKPRAIIFLTTYIDTKMASIGFSDGTNHYAIRSQDDGAGGWMGWSYAATYCIQLRKGGAFWSGYVSSLDSNGFTVNFTVSGGSMTGTCYIMYLAFK